MSGAVHRRAKRNADAHVPDADTGHDFYREIVNDNRHPTPCILMTDDYKILSGFQEGNHKHISSSFLTDVHFPDPYLQISFDASYHEPIPPEDDLLVKDTIVDNNVDEHGYRTTHKGWIKISPADKASLKIFTLEARKKENETLPELLSIASLHDGDSAIAPPILLERYPYLESGLNDGKLLVLRIEFERPRHVKASGMDPPETIGDLDTEWSELAQHVQNSLSFNLVVLSEYGDLEGQANDIMDIWDEKRDRPPFGEFFGI